ncbi:hypothetical protein [Streptomyces sp. NPDC001880]
MKFQTQHGRFPQGQFELPGKVVDMMLGPRRRRVLNQLFNLAIGVHHQDGHADIAAALRRTGRDHQRPLTTPGII